MKLNEYNYNFSVNTCARSRSYNVGFQLPIKACLPRMSRLCRQAWNRAQKINVPVSLVQTGLVSVFYGWFSLSLIDRSPASNGNSLWITCYMNWLADGTVQGWETEVWHQLDVALQSYGLSGKSAQWHSSKYCFIVANVSLCPSTQQDLSTFRAPSYK